MDSINETKIPTQDPFKQTFFHGTKADLSVGDLIEFSAVGYHTDTLYLTSLLNRSIYLPVKSTSLADVDVRAVRMNSQVTDAKDPLAEKYTLLNTGGNLGRKRMKDKVGGLNLNLGYGKYKRQQRKEADLARLQRYHSIQI